MYGKYIFCPSSERSKRFSAEKTDSQLVREAKQARSRETLNIHNFFRAMGSWSNFYTLVILLNGAISTMGYVQLMILTFVVQEREAYSFEDLNGEVQDIMKDTIMFGDSWSNLRKDEMSDDFVMFLMEAGATFGYVILTCGYRKSARFMIICSSIIYAISLILFTKAALPITKASMFVSCACSEICRISSIMVCMESLPRNLRPFGFCLMNFMNEFGYILMLITLRACSDWNYAAAVFGTIYLGIGIAYYLLAPPSIHRSVVRCKKHILVVILEYWAENRGDGLNVEWLIDDIVFKKTVLLSTNHWKKVFFLLFRKTFIKKLAILLLLHLVGGCVLLDTSYNFTEKNTNLGVFEVKLLNCVAHLIASKIMCIMIYCFGRRFCMFSSVWLFVVAHFLGLIIEFNTFDICAIRETPEGYDLVLGWIVSFLLSISSTMIWLMAQFMMIEHIPSSVRSVILPLGHLCTNLVGAILIHIHIYFKGSLSILLHNGFLLPTLVMGLLAAPLAVLLDNSSLMPLTAADVPCYYRPHTRFRDDTNVKFDDQKEEA